jgi:cytochrome c556
MIPKIYQRRAAFALLALSIGGAVVAQAQNAPAPGAARQAVEERRAAFKLLGSNFRPLGALLKGEVGYSAAEVKKRIAREVFIGGLLPEVFSDASNLGEPDSTAKPEVWTNRADFDKKLVAFQEHLAALAAVNDKDQGPSDAFKAALTTVAQDCKGCHDDYKLK